MKSRPTARVLLFDAQGRILLMHMHDPNVAGPDGVVRDKSYWVTIGGGIDSGESAQMAVRRELCEETGLRDVEIGPAVWTRDHVLIVRGEPLWLKEIFFVARTQATGWHTTGWTDLERDVVKELKWWSHEAIVESDETFYPAALKTHLQDLVQGAMPASPIRLDA